MMRDLMDRGLQAILLVKGQDAAGFVGVVGIVSLAMLADARRAAIHHVLVQPEPPGWPGDVWIEKLPFRDASTELVARLPRAELSAAPVQWVRLSDLEALQPTADRRTVVSLLERGWDEPILITPWPGSDRTRLSPIRPFLIQDGHHRAYAAALLGSPRIAAKVLPFPSKKR